MRFLKVFAAMMFILIAVPMFAQADTDKTNRVSFNGFSFSFTPALATHVSITQYLTEPPDVFPPQGKHTHFVIYGESPVDSSIVGIRLYHINDLAQNEQMQQQVTQLKALLAKRGDLTTNAAGTDSPLPFLPVVAAGQIIRARAAYVETADVAGISYITAYQQAAQPLLQSDFLYTFQGISTDGTDYVSAVFRVNPKSFPTEMPSDFDYQTFLDQQPTYLSESAAQLSNAAPESFAPALGLLDAVVQSFAIDS